jgi:small-conductance mechanosensitive channel
MKNINAIFLRPGWVLRTAVILLAVHSATPSSTGQLPGLKKAVEGAEAAKPVSTEKPEDVRKRLESWQQEARDTLVRLEAGGSAAALPEGVTAAELDDRRRDLEQIVLITSSWLKNFQMTAEARKAAEAARAAESSWSGFTEPPPYSILMIDDLLNERDALKAKLTSHESSLANFERILASTLAETKAAEDAIGAGMVAVQNAGAAKAEAAKWRLEAARAKARVLATRGGFLQASCDALKERVAADRSEIALVERKIRTAAPNSRFRDEDLAKIEKIAGERKASLQKELSAVSKRMKSALATKAQAQTSLETLLEKSVDGKEPDGTELARFRLKVAEERIESLQSVTDTIESLIQLENVGLKAYNDRAVLFRSGDAEERRKALASLSQFADRLKAWLNVVENDTTTSGAELSKIESRAASITSDDPRFPLINEQRAARSEMLATLQRSAQLVESQRKLIRRWIADHTPKAGEEGLMERISGVGGTAWAMVKRVWNFEVMSFENKVEVDGQTITGRLPVTLGMLLRAVLFFVVGYWIASRIANRIQHGIVTRGHIAEPQARTLRNWAMIVVGVGLVLGTLSFLKIPLTVFAFFGGALAIGIGFGTQTLIKNFISGIIVLAERKVRVGDILDVDGIVGTVTEVNTRSSIIRGADDIETMIPNSMFLENRVTNWTLSSARMRRSIRVGVAYGTDPRVVMEILTESAGRHGRICKDPAPFAVFDDFGDNALIFTLYFWLDMHGGANAMVIASDLRLMIDKRFNEAGVGIPFPQRDMHLTTGKPISVELVEGRRENAGPP